MMSKHVCSSAACVCVLFEIGVKILGTSRKTFEISVYPVFIEEIGFDRLLFFYYLLFTTFINAYSLIEKESIVLSSPNAPSAK